jgi:hypothetical protein
MLAPRGCHATTLQVRQLEYDALGAAGAGRLTTSTGGVLAAGDLKGEAGRVCVNTQHQQDVAADSIGLAHEWTSGNSRL